MRNKIIRLEGSARYFPVAYRDENEEIIWNISAEDIEIILEGSPYNREFIISQIVVYMGCSDQASGRLAQINCMGMQIKRQKELENKRRKPVPLARATYLLEKLLFDLGISRDKAVLVMIDGDAGVGKTTFIEQLKICRRMVLKIHRDDYILPVSEVDWNRHDLINWELLVEDIRKAQRNYPGGIVLVEGYEIFSLPVKFDLKVKITADVQTRQANVSERNSTSSIFGGDISDMLLTTNEDFYDLIIDNSLRWRIAKDRTIVLGERAERSASSSVQSKVYDRGDDFNYYEWSEEVLNAATQEERTRVHESYKIDSNNFFNPKASSRKGFFKIFRTSILVFLLAIVIFSSVMPQAALAGQNNDIQRSQVFTDSQLTRGPPDIILDSDSQAIQNFDLKFYPVEVKNKKIIINGSAYRIRGVTLSVAKPGFERRDMILNLNSVGNDSIKNMRESGINTVRTYVPPEKDLLDAFADNGIRVIVSFPYHDDRRDRQVDMQGGEYLRYINKFKDHPAILMWEFGNEYNFHPELFSNNVNNWYRLLETSAKKVHSIDPNHPISTAHGGVPVGSIVERIPSVDVWGINIYEGLNAEIFEQWNKIFGKPIYISETGIDSFNDKSGREDESAQAAFNAELAKRIELSFKACAGVTFMSWQDEWWKSGNPAKQDKTGTNPLHSITAGDKFTEEYWGFVDANGRPKEVLDAVAKVWAQNDKIRFEMGMAENKDREQGIERDVNKLDSERVRLSGFGIETNIIVDGRPGYILFKKIEGTNAIFGIVRKILDEPDEEVIFLMKEEDYKYIWVQEDGYYTVFDGEEVKLGDRKELLKAIAVGDFSDAVKTGVSVKESKTNREEKGEKFEDTVIRLEKDGYVKYEVISFKNEGFFDNHKIPGFVLANTVFSVDEKVIYLFYNGSFYRFDKEDDLTKVLNSSNWVNAISPFKTIITGRPLPITHSGKGVFVIEKPVVGDSTFGMIELSDPKEKIKINPFTFNKMRYFYKKTGDKYYAFDREYGDLNALVLDADEDVQGGVLIESVGKLKDGRGYVLLSGAGEHSDEYILKVMYKDGTKTDILADNVEFTAVWKSMDKVLTLNMDNRTYLFNSIAELKHALENGELMKNEIANRITSTVYKVGDLIFVYTSGVGENVGEHTLKIIDPLAENTDNVFEPTTDKAIWHDDDAVIFQVRKSTYKFSSTDVLVSALKQESFPALESYKITEDGKNVNQETFELQYYAKPQISDNGIQLLGVITIGSSKKVSDLPDDVKSVMRDVREYSGEEEIGEVYFFGSEHRPLLEDGLGLQGYSVKVHLNANSYYMGNSFSDVWTRIDRFVCRNNKGKVNVSFAGEDWYDKNGDLRFFRDKESNEEEKRIYYLPESEEIGSSFDVSGDYSGYDFIYFFTKEKSVSLKVVDTKGNDFVFDDSSNIRFWHPVDINKLYGYKGPVLQEVVSIVASNSLLYKNNVRVVPVEVLRDRGIDVRQIKQITILAGNKKINPNLYFLGDKSLKPESIFIDYPSEVESKWGKRGKIQWRCDRAVLTTGRSFGTIGIIDPDNNFDIWSTFSEERGNNFGGYEGAEPLFTVQEPFGYSVNYSLWKSSRRLFQFSARFKDSTGHNWSISRDVLNVFGVMKATDDDGNNVIISPFLDVMYFPGDNNTVRRMSNNIFNYNAVRPGMEVGIDGLRECIMNSNLLGIDAISNAMQQPRIVPYQLTDQLAPWDTQSEDYDGTLDISHGREKFIDWVTQYHETHPCNLIPTVLFSDHEIENYVSTMEEADIIHALLASGKQDIAGELLAVYRVITGNGKSYVAESYHVSNYNPLAYNSNTQNAEISKPNSLAVLALSEQALDYAQVTGKADDYQFAFNLLQAALEFRATVEQANVNYTGFTHRFPVKKLSVGEIKKSSLNPNRYELVTNSKGLTILKKFNVILGGSENKLSESLAALRLKVRDAISEQELWLDYIWNRMGSDPSGLVPASFVELYDYDVFEGEGISKGYLIAEPWISSDAIFAFVEVMHERGKDEIELRGLVDNLGRINGVEISGRNGIERELPTGERSDAIFYYELTELYHIADILDYEKVKGWAETALEAGYRDNLMLPVVYSGMENNSAVFPIVAHGERKYIPQYEGEWPDSSAATARLLFNRVDVKGINDNVDLSGVHLSPQGHILNKSIRSLWNNMLAVWSSFIFLSFFFGLFIYTLLTSLLRKIFKDKFQNINRRAGVDSSLTSDSVENNLLESHIRWAEKILGRIRLKGLSHTFVGDGPLEGNFFFSLKTIYTLVCNWSELKNMNIEEKNNWLNGLDAFSLMLALYARKRIADGMKDGEKGIEDSNHIWHRLEMYLYEYRELLRNAIAEGNYEKFGNILEELGVCCRETPVGNINEIRIDILSERAWDDFDTILRELGLSCAKFKDFERAFIDFVSREDIRGIPAFAVELASFLPKLFFVVGGIAILRAVKTGVNPFVNFMSIWDIKNIDFIVYVALFLIIFSFGTAAVYQIFKHFRWYKKINVSGIKKYAYLRKLAKCLWFVGIAFLLFAGIMINSGFVTSAGAALVLSVIFVFLPLVEIIGWIFYKHSIFLLSLKYYLRPAAHYGSLRGLITYHLFNIVYIILGIFTGITIFDWFGNYYIAGGVNLIRLFIGLGIFLNSLYLLYFSLWIMVTSFASFTRTFPAQAFVAGTAFAGFIFGLPWYISLLVIALPVSLKGITSVIGNIKNKINRLGDEERVLPLQSAEYNNTKICELYIGVDKLSVLPLYLNDDSLDTATEEYYKRWVYLRDQNALGIDLRLEEWGLTGLSYNQIDETVKISLRALHNLEASNRLALWDPEIQIKDTNIPPQIRMPIVNESYDAVLRGWRIRRWLSEMLAQGGESVNVGINLVEHAKEYRRRGLGGNVVFYLISNKYSAKDPAPTDMSDSLFIQQRDKLAQLLEYVLNGRVIEKEIDQATGRLVASDKSRLSEVGTAYVLHGSTAFGFKSAAMTAMDFIPEESLNIGTMIIIDRGATCLDVPRFVDDVLRHRADENLVITVTSRGTTNTIMPIGQASQLIEEGHRSYLKGVIGLLGGDSSESVGTGWGNILTYFYGYSIRFLTKDPRYPAVPLTSRLRYQYIKDRGIIFTIFSYFFGLIGFIPHAVGISEDLWSVEEGTHSQIGLGRKPVFRLGKAFWHKIRESYSHISWFSAYPRWSGGYIQARDDYLMQTIHDYGPMSVYSKDIRRNGGRFFLTVRFAFLNIAIMALAVIFDLSPFSGILLIFWVMSLIFNQILTLHGLNSYLEASGFNRIFALIGFVTAGLLSANIWFAVLCAIPSGFIAGIGRWLSGRVRDTLLFSIQLLVYCLSQSLFIRQTLEFLRSGGKENYGDMKNHVLPHILTALFSAPYLKLKLMIITLSFGVAAFLFVNPFTYLSLFLQNIIFSIGFTLIILGCISLLFLNKDWEKTRLVNPFSVFMIGIIITALNILAIMNLNLLNAFMLYPTLIFSVCLVIGMFVSNHRQGAVILGGWGDSLFKAAGFALGVLTLFSVSRLAGGLSLINPLVSSGLGALLTVIMLGLWLYKGHDIIIKNKYTKRAVSETLRSYWTTIAFLGWFVLVPLTPVISFTINNTVIAIPYTYLFKSSLMIGVVFAGLIILGKIADFIEYQWFKRNQYNKFIHTFNAKKDILDNTSVSLIEALLTQIATFINQKAYGYAKVSLREAEFIFYQGIKNNLSFPMSMPSAGWAPSGKDAEKMRADVLKYLGGREKMSKMKFTLIFDSKLESPAETVLLKGGRYHLLVNPNVMVNAPPEQLRIIFQGHELFHLEGDNELLACKKTTEYLIKNNLLIKHIDFLKENDLGMRADKNWLNLLSGLSSSPLETEAIKIHPTVTLVKKLKTRLFIIFLTIIIFITSFPGILSAPNNHCVQTQTERSGQSVITQKHSNDQFLKAYCGERVLEQAFKVLEITEDESSKAVTKLHMSAQENKGFNSLYEIREAARESGLKAVALKGDISMLKNLSEHGVMIANITGNRHFCFIKEVKDNSVFVYIPGLNKEWVEMRYEEFAKTWDSVVLLLSDENIDESVYNGRCSRVSDTELKDIIGAQACANTLGGSASLFVGGSSEDFIQMRATEFRQKQENGYIEPSSIDSEGKLTINTGNGSNVGMVDSAEGVRSDPVTKEPVNIMNGNLFVENSDINIPSIGMPLKFTRYYNTQVTSHVQGWMPEPGAGTWVIEDGEYSGQGDRTISVDKFKNFTLELDMRTLKAGEDESWQTARVNFRYEPQKDDVRKVNNGYYFLIHTDGKLELCKWAEGHAITLAKKKSDYNPIDNHRIKIKVFDRRITIYVDDNTEISTLDPYVIRDTGTIALEAYYCHAHFDNIKITSDKGNYKYEFNDDDNEFQLGYGWTHNYSVHIKEHKGYAILYRENNQKDFFVEQHNGEYKPVYSAGGAALIKDSEGFDLKLKNGRHYRFYSDGRLNFIEDGYGNRHTLKYAKLNGRLIVDSVSDATGRAIGFRYYKTGDIGAVVDPSGNPVKFAYDDKRFLIGVTDRDGNLTKYSYDETTRNLSKVTDPEGNEFR
ncbi:MAG: DUF6531 domain-containing protein, partial [Candidatus Omnitrophota bacterium]